MGFFQLKNAGRNPSDLGDSVFPVLDLRDWYMQARAELIPVASRSLAATTVGIVFFTTAAPIVPEGEAWWVINYHVVASIVNGENVAFSCAWVSPNSDPNIPPNTVPQPLLAGPAANSRQGLSFCDSFFLQPGSQLCIFVSANEGAASIEFSGTGQFVRLPL
jgi:hypothetical protein